MRNKQIIIIFILLILSQSAHFIEELIGNASFITNVYNGENNFLIISLILLLIPIVLFYFAIRGNKKAKLLSYLYGIIIVIDGLWHLFTRTPGIYSSIGLIIFGLLFIYILKARKNHE